MEATLREVQDHLPEYIARAQAAGDRTVETAPHRVIASDVVDQLRVLTVALRVRVQVAAAGAADPRGTCRWATTSAWGREWRAAEVRHRRSTAMLALEAVKLTKNAIALPFMASGDTPFTGNATPGRQFATAAVPMARIDAIRQVARATLNHVALTCLDGAMHRYLADEGVTLDRPITIQMPVNLRREGEKAAGKKYFQAGLTIADTLFAEPYLSTDAKHQGLLLHSVYHRPNGWDYVPKGRSVPCGEACMWGDYHAMELALLIRRMAEGRYYTFF